MDVLVTPDRGELVSLVRRELAAATLPRTPGRCIVNLATQPPNSLLHDGHRWRRYQPARLVADTRAALRQARGGSFFVHASYAFAGAPQARIAPGSHLGPVIEAALDAEDLVLRAAIPSCVVRLGYLYGPESRDLRAYRRAFRLGRPYWAGPRSVRHRHVHTHDAARALVAAARQHPAGRILHVSDDQPVSFATFMDHFARLSGNPIPLHLPRVSRPISRFVIAEAHMEMVDLDTAAAAGGPRPRGFRLQYPTYRSGLRQVIEAWSADG